MTTKLVEFILSFFAFILFFTGCFSFAGNGRTSDEMEKLFFKNQEGFGGFAQYFLSQDEIKSMGLDTRKEEHCEDVNLWVACPDEKGSWRRLTGERVAGISQKEYLSSLTEVLIEEGIKQENFDKTRLFMEKHKLLSVTKSEQENYLEIEDGLSGLRYYVETDNNFMQDEEYIYVKRLNNHWFVYTRDWN